MCVCVCVFIHTYREKQKSKRERRGRESKYQCSSTEAPRKDLQRRQKQASSSDRLQLLQTSNPILTHNAILSSFKREQGLASSTKKSTVRWNASASLCQPCIRRATISGESTRGSAGARWEESNAPADSV